MTHAAYILPAYALTIGGLLVLVVTSWVRMRLAERAADAVREQRR